jgi:hypothetical protein
VPHIQNGPPRDVHSASAYLRLKADYRAVAFWLGILRHVLARLAHALDLGRLCGLSDRLIAASIVHDVVLGIVIAAIRWYYWAVTEIPDVEAECDVSDRAPLLPSSSATAAKREACCKEVPTS